MGTHKDANIFEIKLKKRLEELIKIDYKNLIKSGYRDVDINFNDVEPIYDTYFDYIKKLRKWDISKLPSNKLSTLVGNLEHINKNLKAIENFKIESGKDTFTSCESVITNIKNSYDNYVEDFAEALSLSLIHNIDPDTSKIREAVNEEIRKFLEHLTSQRIKIDKSVEAAQYDSANKGIEAYGKEFSDYAEDHEMMVWRWFFGTIICSILTLGASIIFLVILFNPDLFSIKFTLNDTNKLPFIVSKIVILSILSFGIFWSSRNYKAHKHNQILNEHRANALNTFTKYYHGTEEKDIQSAILLQASHSAFSYRSTGYDNQDKEIQSINPIMDFIKKTTVK